ncbi:NAD(P)-binding protein [Mycena capillaripes]|nr:NAD(P)-binding protein [Mycena capillaripes]
MPGYKGIALVTGAAQGIGRCVALKLADDGFDVAVNDVASSSETLGTLVDQIVAKGRSSSKHIADVSQEDQVKEMVEQVVKQHGGLDVMVANAGVTGRPGVPFTEIPSEEWDRVMNTNARRTFLCYKYAGMQMVKQGRGGRIIGASSIAGKKGLLMQGPYCASKFAVRGLTQAAAMEFGPHGITVNAYAPGAIDTPMLSAASVTGDPSDIIKNNIQMSALKRIGVPDDISNLVSFLASKESQFITGQSISVNGGIWFD